MKAIILLSLCVLLVLVTGLTRAEITGELSN